METKVNDSLVPPYGGWLDKYPELGEQLYKIPYEYGEYKWRSTHAPIFKELMEYLHKHNIETGLIDTDIGGLLQGLISNMNYNENFRIVIDHNAQFNRVEMKGYLYPGSIPKYVYSPVKILD